MRLLRFQVDGASKMGAGGLHYLEDWRMAMRSLLCLVEVVMATECFHPQVHGVMVLKLPRCQVDKVMAMKSLLYLIRNSMASHGQASGTIVLKSRRSQVDRFMVMRSLLCLPKSPMAFYTQDNGSSMMLTFLHSQVDKVTARIFQYCLPIGAIETGYLCILVKGVMMLRHVDYQATSKVLLVGVGTQEATSKGLLVGAGT
ncbi:hypothetical protein ACQ4PT_043043 [Festuca glaucescens]